MNLGKLFEEYEKIDCEIYELIECMKDWNCPDLIVEEKQIPKELQKKSAFDKKDVAPLNGGEKSRLSENIVEYYVYEDIDEYNPLLTKKYTQYIKEKLAPSMIIITHEYGNYQRKEGDFRFTDKVNVKKETAYFLYDYFIKEYKQVNAKKEEWIERLAEREQVRKQSIDFIYFYKTFKDAIWVKKINPFDKSKYIYGFSKEVESLGEIEFIETINFFLFLSELYIFILEFFGSITNDEYKHLLQAIEKQKERNYKCYEYIMLKEEGLFDDFASVLNLSKSDSFYQTKLKITFLLTPREERLEVITPANYHRGYVFIDTEKGICYPNLGELDRRINLFQMAANSESEKDIIQNIIKIAKQKKKL